MPQAPAPAHVSASSNTGRSIWAVVAGFIFVVVLSLGTDQVLHVLNVYPPWGEPMWDSGLNALALAYRSVFTVLGMYFTAKLAPQNPMRLVTIGGVIGTVLATLGVVGSWSMNLGPHWYPIALAVTAFPLSWVGGWWFVRRQNQH